MTKKTDPKPHTHIAYAWKPMGRRPHQGYWAEIGYARHDPETGRVHAYLDRLTIGFRGRVIFNPIGNNIPPPPDPAKPDLDLPGLEDAEAEPEGED